MNYIECEKLIMKSVNTITKDRLANRVKRPNYVKGDNFMTPDSMAYLKKGNRVVEVSYGRGFASDYLIGLTVYDNRQSNHEASDCCQLGELTDKLGELLS